MNNRFYLTYVTTMIRMNGKKYKYIKQSMLSRQKKLKG